MLDLTSALPVIVITVLTILLSITGFYLILVLRDLRVTIRRVNHLLDQAETTLHKVSHPTESIGNLIGGLREGLKIVDSVSNLLSRRNQETAKQYGPDAF